MSLNLTSVSTPHEKPLPPSRSKRTSIIESKSPSAHREGRELRPLRERGDVDLERATREELVQSIREQWDERDRLLMRIGDLEEGEGRCMTEKGELTRALQGMQDRLNSVFSEQSKLEADVEARDGLLDRVRSRLAMVERDLREAQNRALSQEKAFEAERASAQAQEAHLNTRIRQLRSSSSSTSSSTKLAKPSSAPPETLQEDLDSLRVSHHHLLSQLDSLSAEIQECLKENERLKEENEGWEYLVRERTFQGHLFQREQTQAGDGSGRLEALDEELESEMNDLHSELDVHSPALEDEQTLSRSSTVRKGARRPEDGLTSRQTSMSGSSFVDQVIQGMDLAAELGRADPPAPGSRGFSSSLRSEAGEDALQKENKKLKEEVKGLQLYCSKIIDRIIAQDGFEHILSVDYKTKRMGRSASGRGSLQSVVQMMHADQPTPSAPPSTSTIVGDAMSASSAPVPPPVRPTGTLIHGLTDYPTTSSQEQTSTPDKSEKRARRGFSLDLRSFGFGSSSSANTPTETKPPLRPLTLTPSATSAPARKLEPQAEDEEDKRERHRLDAALKLMGIDKPSTASPTSTVDVFNPPPPPPPVRRSSSIRSSTPLSRLSSALGFTDTASQQQKEIQLPADPDPSPEVVNAALKEYDAQEEIRRRSLSKGQAEGGYTSPPRRGSSRRQSADVGGGHKARGSISSLWSRAGQEQRKG